MELLFSSYAFVIYVQYYWFFFNLQKVLHKKQTILCSIKCLLNNLTILNNEQKRKTKNFNYSLSLSCSCEYPCVASFTLRKRSRKHRGALNHLKQAVAHNTSAVIYRREMATYKSCPDANASRLRDCSYNVKLYALNKFTYFVPCYFNSNHNVNSLKLGDFICCL